MNILKKNFGGGGWQNYLEKFRYLPTIVIYGAGAWGKRCLHLFQYNHINVMCFAVANKNDNPVDIEGYPVRSINELKEVKKEISIILGLEQATQFKVAENLRELGFEHIFPLDMQEFWLSDMAVSNCNPKGEKICPVCRNKVKIFCPSGEHMRFGALCPYCSSRERHRAYWLYWEKSKLFNGTGMKLLHFAPERAFFDKISNMKFIDYYPVDINPKLYGVKRKVDITDIIYNDNEFDVIICNHVLEHIPNEKKAMSELRRVLKKEGKAFLNVPVFEAYKTTLEKTDYNTPELRLRYYGQSDHVRAYGVDYEERLRLAGFKAEKIMISKDYSEKELERYGLRGSEYIYECRKA